MGIGGTTQRALERYLGRVTGRPWRVLCAIAAITLLLAWPLPRLSFKTTIYDLLIQDLPEVEGYHAFREVFGSDELIQIVIKAQSIYDPTTFAKVARISNDAARIAGVVRVLSLPEVKKSVDPGGNWDLEKFRNLLAPVVLFQRNLISADNRTTIVTLVVAAEADKETLIQSVRQLLEASGKDLHLYQIGIPLVSEAMVDFTRRDFFSLTPITLLVIALLLAVLYRRVVCIVLPVACVLLSVVWTFGSMAWLQIPVTMLTLIVPIFLIAVGTAYCIIICTEYLIQVGRAASSRAACQAAFGRLTLPMTLVVATTLIGIGSMVTNDIPTIKEFAAFSCFGMLSLLVLILTFFPATLSIFPIKAKPKEHRSSADHVVERLLAAAVSITLKHRKGTLIGFGLVTLVCLVGVFRIRVETNPVAFFKSSAQVSRHFNDIFQDMSGSFPINLVLSTSTPDFFEEAAHLKMIERLQAFLGQLNGVDKTISFADYLRLINYVTNGFNTRYYVLPQEDYELRMLLNQFKSLLGNDLLQRFMSPDFSRTNIMMLTHLSSSEQFLETKAKILERVQADFGQAFTWQVTGLGMVIAASSHLLTLGQVQSLALSLALIFAVMVTLFVSFKVGLIAVVPNIFPILVNFGIMGWLGISLSAATSLIAGVVIGLAVDDILHYLVRYNEEFKKDLDKDRAMRDTLMTTGRPIVFTSCTISLGFAVLIFSHFQPTALFGVLMVITMLSAMAGDLILLPALMLHVELVTAWDMLKLMPSLGGVPPPMVHELNQPLNAIKVGSDFLKMMLKQGAPVQPKHLAYISTEISQQVERASQIIQRLSQVGRPSDFAKTSIDLNAPIHSVIELLENQFKLDTIDVRLELATDLPPILGHHNRLMQVMYNLIINAAEAIAEARAIDGGQTAHAITLRSWADAQRVWVSVRDSGIGIAEHYKGRVFEPFFTTKQLGKGKGLGLSISQEIIRDCGGRITVESTLGEGTHIAVCFPRLAQATDHP